MPGMFSLYISVGVWYVTAKTGSLNLLNFMEKRGAALAEIIPLEPDLGNASVGSGKIH